jgi:diaminopimelate decarboxylase
MENGDAWRALQQTASDRTLRPRGLHLHLGTGLKDVSGYLRAIREMLEFGRRARLELGLTIDHYDFGGGFGVPTVRTRDAWDSRREACGHSARLALPAECPSPGEYAGPIMELLHEFFPTGPLPQVIFEPGRAVTSSAQLLLLRVIDVKPAPAGGVDQVICDGGKNVALPLEWESHQVFAVSRADEPDQPVQDLFGPLCHPGDVLCRGRRFPRLAAGDVLAVMDSGAYFIPNQMNFSHPRPAVAMLDDEGLRLIRRREEFEDLVRLDAVETGEPA